MKAAGFAVFDLETTGLFPGRNDRIVEIAVVQLDPTGAVTGRWQSIIHPDRDLGPTHIHGLRGADMDNAPRFQEISDELLELFDNRVIVAHNAAFDCRFLATEWQRSGVLDQNTFPGPYICTMQLASRMLPGSGRKLIDCCAAFGIELKHAHSALGDAEATAQLVGQYLQVPGFERYWAEVLQNPFTSRALRRLGSRGMAVTRPAGSVQTPEPFADLIPNVDAADYTAEENNYLGLLDRCLEDGLISLAEAQQLAQLASELNIPEQQRQRLHVAYFDQIVAAAWADHVLTEDETNQIDTLGRVLSLNRAKIDAAKLPPVSSSPAPVTAETLDLKPGDTIVLTGTMSIPRSDWQQRLESIGLIVANGVTKKTSVLVAADPTSLSGKAKKARQYGVPIVDENWLIDAVTPLGLK